MDILSAGDRRALRARVVRFCLGILLQMNSSSLLNVRTLAWIAIALIIGTVLWLIGPILAPFLAGAIFAYILNPLVTRLSGRYLPRSIAAGIVLLLTVLLLSSLLLLILPLLLREARLLGERLPEIINWINVRAVPWIHQHLGVELKLDIDSLRAWTTEFVQSNTDLLPRVLGSLKIGGLALFGYAANLLLMPVVLFYLLRDWNTLITRIDALIPRRLHATVCALLHEIDLVLAEFLRGQLLVVVTMSTYYVTGLWLAGLEFALPVGLLAGVLTIVPYAGPATAYTLALVAAVIQFDTSTGILLVGAVLLCGQLLEGFLVTPMLVGERIGLHPLAVLFALLAFGQVFGFFGVLLALPASAALLVGLRHLQRAYQSGPLYLGPAQRSGPSPQGHTHPNDADGMR
jgi:predicted PurR-regulated permease PerM